MELVWEPTSDPWAVADAAGINILSHMDFVVGYESDDVLVAALFDSAESGDDECYSFDIAVLPNWQKKGLGNLLMDLAIDKYDELTEPFPDIRFCLDAVNPTAAAMLKKRGFHETGRSGNHTLMSRNPPGASENPVALTDHKPWGTAIPDVAAVPRWAVPNPPAKGFKYADQLWNWAEKRGIKDSATFANENLGGTGAKSAAQVASHMAKISRGRLDLDKVRSELSKTGNWYYLHKVDVASVDAGTHGHVDPSGDEDLDVPIVVNAKGEVIDGRHRVGLAKGRGIKEIPAYMPASRYYEDTFGGPRSRNPPAECPLSAWPVLLKKIGHLT
tara:strand:+ start:537 stop:1526 length:990 start_codon:yes stop_codon:yes gene_type:complete